MDIEENISDINMDEVLEDLMNDYYWQLPTNDIQQIKIPTELNINYITAFIDYKINHCKVKRIQDYYIVKCPYCDAKQYEEKFKPMFEEELINCKSLKCKKIFLH